MGNDVHHTGIVTRAYNHWGFDWLEGTAKKSGLTERIENEINYYKQIPKDFKIYFPRLLETTKDSYTMEYYGYPDLGKLMLFPHKYNLPDNFWINVFGNLFQIRWKWSRMECYGKEKSRRESAYHMYITKTAREVNNYYENYNPKIEKYQSFMLNGKQVLNFPQLWDQGLKSYVQNWIVDTYDEVKFIHGDMCFSNILVGILQPNMLALKFIDPRGSFGNKGCFGDPRYDIAKLWHSVDGYYEWFNNDLFSVYADWGAGFDVNITGDISQKRHMEVLKKMFREMFFARWSEKDITIIEGLIFVGAAARHYENPERQLALYLTGVEKLNVGMNL